MYIPSPPYHETINKLLYSILQYFKGNPIPMNLPRPPFYNTTNDLLYAILNSLNGGVQTVYTQFRVLYVSARYGNDETAQANNSNFPYKTITAAKNASFFGDIIHVMEGIYDEGNLFGSYTYWFDYGAEINYSGSGSIFQQWFGECNVRGYGKFRATNNGFAVDVGNWFNCVLDMECELIEAVNNPVRLFQNRFFWLASNYKPHRIRTRRIYSSQHYAVHPTFNVHCDVQAEEIITDSYDKEAMYVTNPRLAIIRNSVITGNNFRAVYGDSLGFLEFDNCKIRCNWNNPEGHALYLDGYIYYISLRNTHLSCSYPDAKSIFSNWNAPIYLDNNITANRDTGGVLLNYVNQETKLLLEQKETVLDITGLTSIDLANCQNAEVIKLTSTNVNEMVNQIVNAPKHHSYRIAPSAGLVLTLFSGNPSSASENDVILESPSITLVGLQGDWIELHNNAMGTGNRQINASNYQSNG